MCVRLFMCFFGCNIAWSSSWLYVMLTGIGPLSNSEHWRCFCIFSYIFIVTLIMCVYDLTKTAIISIRNDQMTLRFSQDVCEKSFSIIRHFFILNVDVHYHVNGRILTCESKKTRTQEKQELRFVSTFICFNQTQQILSFHFGSFFLSLPLNEGLHRRLRWFRWNE